MSSRRHAVVLGAGMAGLMTARVLSEHFDQVTVVERDVLTASPDHRRGVPQGRHVHALLPGGCQVLEELFPGVVAELSAAGAPLLDDLRRMHFEVSGHLLSRTPSPLQPAAVQASRPFLEGVVRRRLRELDNVVVVDGYDVLGMVAAPGCERVSGVWITQRDDVNGARQFVHADVVVDALGRGGRTLAAVRSWGYPVPVEETVKVDITYTSLPLRLRRGALDGDLFLIGAAPGRLTSMGLFAYENDFWVLTVMGYGRSCARPDLDSMRQHVEQMAPPQVVAALSEAEPLDEVRVHRYPASRRRRYDRMRRFPAGLLVVGDAWCSVNPVYGQGMTVAAKEALVLRHVLATSSDDTTLAPRFFQAANRFVDTAWKLSVGSDLALPEIPGRRGLATRVLAHYLDRLLAVAEHDPQVATQFLRVTGFLDPVTALMQPWMTARVARGPSRTPKPAATVTASAAVALEPEPTPEGETCSTSSS